ncbi:7420_t:CDS:2, partial [Diversispora eburnea]
MPKQFTYSELSEKYNGKDNKPLYFVINGKVVDATKFKDEHPGGEEVLIGEGGMDATDSFESIGHSDEAREILQSLVIGEAVGEPLSSKPESPLPKSEPSPSPLPSLEGGSL